MLNLDRTVREAAADATTEFADRTDRAISNALTVFDTRLDEFRAQALDHIEISTYVVAGAIVAGLVLAALILRTPAGA
jgi:ABC-type proline/glycine betaine transport system permease subunit